MARGGGDCLVTETETEEVTDVMFKWTLKIKLLPITNVFRLYMFVVSDHLYRPLLLSQSWELGCQILGGFGTHP